MRQRRLPRKPLKIRFANIDYHTKIAAPFLTAEVFVQGCNVEPKCPGCWNRSLWDFDAPARELSPYDAARLLIESVPYRRLTICGGEPFAQALPLAEMCRILKWHQFFIMSYTGWTWEELMAGQAGGVKRKDILRFLNFIDVLIDGRYDPFVRNPNIGKDYEWIGSLNQRIIHVPRSLYRGEPVVITVDEVKQMAYREGMETN